MPPPEATGYPLRTASVIKVDAPGDTASDPLVRIECRLIDIAERLAAIEAKIGEYEPLAAYARARVGRSWRGRNTGGQ